MLPFVFKSLLYFFFFFFFTVRTPDVKVMVNTMNEVLMCISAFETDVVVMIANFSWEVSELGLLDWGALAH